MYLKYINASWAPHPVGPRTQAGVASHLGTKNNNIYISAHALSQCQQAGAYRFKPERNAVSMAELGTCKSGRARACSGRLCKGS